MSDAEFLDLYGKAGQMRESKGPAFLNRPYNGDDIKTFAILNRYMEHLEKVDNAHAEAGVNVVCLAEMQVLTNSGMAMLFCNENEDHKGPHRCEIEWG